MSVSEIKTCLVNYRPSTSAQVRLFCFPYAGGSAAVFSSWADRLFPYVDLWIVEYPGRGRRRREQLVACMDALVEDIIRYLPLYVTKPFAMFGHSMGALVAFEVLRRLHASVEVRPQSLFVSACRGPSMRSTLKQTHALPDAEFIEELRSLNGMPDEIVNDSELLRLFLPALRADFRVTRLISTEQGLSCHVPFSLTADQRTSLSTGKTWRRGRNKPVAAASCACFQAIIFTSTRLRTCCFGCSCETSCS
jgi:medium-chain acyl-[acyl-carrier-protein] hydrolase